MECAEDVLVRSSTERNHSAGNIRALIPDVEELLGIFWHLI